MLGQAENIGFTPLLVCQSVCLLTLGSDHLLSARSVCLLTQNLHVLLPAHQSVYQHIGFTSLVCPSVCQ